ncbi:MAG: hypothetical protein AAF515_20515 [Pseudomonadota bacterium]
MRRFLQPYRETWQEAMLTATLEFVWRELGITNIYYHEFRTGCDLKRIRYGHPPRSIYEALPRKFCMHTAAHIPRFLRGDRSTRRLLKRLNAPRFYTHGDDLQTTRTERSACS